MTQKNKEIRVQDVVDIDEVVEYDPYLGLNPAQVLAQVIDEYNAGYEFIRNKRELFAKRLALYQNQQKSADKIGINTLYNVIQSLLSIYYSDELSVSFISKDFGDDDIAENLENLALYDHDQMGMDKINYQVQWDRFFYGVGIRLRAGWDDVRKLPMFQVMDPLSWIPDPNGDILSDSFRFHGFVTQMDIDDISPQNGFFNIQHINDSQDKSFSKDKIAPSRGLSSDSSDKIVIYNHYTIIDGEKYLVSTANSNTLIIRIVKLMPVGDIEKSDSTQVPFPVVLNYYSPLRGDVFGVSIPDLLEDKQRAKSILANLRLIQEKRNALGGEFLYDPTMIKNKNDLITPALGPKYIPVDSSQKPIGSAIMEMPRNSIANTMDNTTQMITQEEMMSSGLDMDNIIGNIGEKPSKLNPRFILGYKINSWGEKAFWNQWYRSYKEFFGHKDTKLVKISTSFGKKNEILSKKDFVMSKDPDIIVASKSVSDTMMQSQKANFLALYPIIMQDPSIPQISKKFALRKLYRLNGIPKDQIDILVPQTYEEMQAEQDIRSINQNIAIQVQDLAQDHMTYIIMYAKAQDTEAKYISIENRKKALIESGQLLKTQELTQNNINRGMMNMAASQIFSSSVAGQRKSD